MDAQHFKPFLNHKKKTKDLYINYCFLFFFSFLRFIFSLFKSRLEGKEIDSISRNTTTITTKKTQPIDNFASLQTFSLSIGFYFCMERKKKRKTFSLAPETVSIDFSCLFLFFNFSPFITRILIYFTHRPKLNARRFSFVVRTSINVTYVYKRN